ncbi:MAG: hypothetical protein ABSC54_04340 [Smithellaceae bacterium]
MNDKYGLRKAFDFFIIAKAVTFFNIEIISIYCHRSHSGKI